MIIGAEEDNPDDIDVDDNDVAESDGSVGVVGVVGVDGSVGIEFDETSREELSGEEEEGEGDLEESGDTSGFNVSLCLSWDAIISSLFDSPHAMQ